MTKYFTEYSNVYARTNHPIPFTNASGIAKIWKDQMYGLHKMNLDPSNFP